MTHRYKMPSLVRFALASVLIVPLFTLAALAIDGPYTPIARIFQLADDAVVTIRGRVVRQIKNDEFIVRDSSGDVVVDVEREIHFGVAVGQEIAVRGIVDIGLFRDKVIKAQQVAIMNPEVTTSPDPSNRADLRSIWAAYFSSNDGDIVTVAGTIVRRLDQREIIIRDKSGEIIVDAEFSKFHDIPLTTGTGIIVTGEVDIYWGGPWREIEAHNIQVQKELPVVALPNELKVLPILEVRQNSPDGTLVTFSGIVTRQLDQDDFLFQDDTADIAVKADQRLFSHHGLTPGRRYLVTGRVARRGDGTVEVVAILIAAEVELIETVSVNEVDCNEIPISNVYYDILEGQVVCVAGSIVRVFGDTELLLQDETGTMVIRHTKDKFQSLDLKVGMFVLVTGRVELPDGGGRELLAENILVRKRN